MPTYIQKPSAQLSEPLEARSDSAVKAEGALELGIVLDQSASMSGLVNETMPAFNALVNEQRAASQGAALSLALFNHGIKLFYDGLSIGEVEPLSGELYKPAGGTALNNAIGSMNQRSGNAPDAGPASWEPSASGPSSSSCAGLLKAARLKEFEITGRQMRVFKDTPARYWYVSGIVLGPELIGGRAIRILLLHGVGSWLSSANVEFPSKLLALAYSKKGEALLEGFNFFKIQNASTMPGRVPLFGLQLADKQQLVSLLRDRGLEIH